MNIKVQSGKTRLLLVEGKSDKEFFIQLGFHLKFTKDLPLQIMTYDGKDNLNDFLALIQADAPFPTLTHIGIVRDADFDGKALTHIQNALNYANSENTDRPQYPDIEVTQHFAGENLQVGAFIMPDATSDGMLESLILRSLSEDKIMDCVDHYFACLEKMGIEPKPEPFAKAKMRVYMTALYQGKMRAFIEGKNVDVGALGSDKGKSYLSDIYKMTWWDWNHPVFTDVKSFIRQLVE